jgi:hypothetical protein
MLPIFEISLQQGTFSNLPSWLKSGPVPIIIIVVLGLLIIGAWVNNRLNRVQKKLHDLGQSYYAREMRLQNDFKSGLMSENEYRKKHDRMVQEMREDSRRIADGPP